MRHKKKTEEIRGEHLENCKELVKTEEKEEGQGRRGDLRKQITGKMKI